MFKTDRSLFLHFLVLSFIFLTYTSLWLVLNLYFVPDDMLNNYFTDSYGIIAGIGGIIGFAVARRWGGFRSVFGRSLSLISIGLFFQFLGQVSYAIYFYVYHIDNPYPSFGEIFYFGSIPIYIYGVWLLGRATGAMLNFKSVNKSAAIVVIPALMVYIAYKFFLIDYEFDLAYPITTFLDIGYPVGQALLVSLATLVFINSKTVLGGVMKKYVLFIIYALALQYLADSVFLYHTINDTWRAGGFDDLLFLVSYFFMGLSLYRFSEAATVLSDPNIHKIEDK